MVLIGIVLIGFGSYFLVHRDFVEAVLFFGSLMMILFGAAMIAVSGDKSRKGKK